MYAGIPEHLGKRKAISGTGHQLGHYSELAQRPTAVPREHTESHSEDSESEDGSVDLRDVFQRHFEAQFAPLQSQGRSTKLASRTALQTDHVDIENSSWNGFVEEDDSNEDQEEQHQVKVVELRDVTRSDYSQFRAEKKAFMSSRPPTSSAVWQLDRKRNRTKGEDDDEDTREETHNLKKDLELQRLISESHLLDESKGRNTRNQRSKIMDVRLRAVGAKQSVLPQNTARMPMAIRKGIASKANEREAKRRREARENGVILERAVGKKPGQQQRQRSGEGRARERGRGVSDPAVGKFRGGATLQLSKRDIAEIRGVGIGGRGGRSSSSVKNIRIR